MAIDNESFELLLSSVQRFVRERLMPAEDAVEEHDEVPADIVEDMKAARRDPLALALLVLLSSSTELRPQPARGRS